MANVVVTFKVMPESPDVSLEDLRKIVQGEIEAFGANLVGEMSEEPVAFGIKALKVSFAYDEKKGTTDDLEETLTAKDGVQSVDVLAVSRGMG